ncbi:hypothetical protein BU251_09300 [Candidatus Velamenicoccus archaeovorus]|jgi:hypothetical protein|uniref:Uncharacterized protein n=1 Tax=Velamenicoccus archaeovorus TaxID=1930593 RepID=A0A410P6S5_VELA1|nr:hypothetical protein BU251_09300 [Candidatus Velamenicoccus archaeovorus]
MKVIQGLKRLYQGLSRYNRDRLIEANRPFGKDPKEFIRMLIWLFAISAIVIGIVLIIGGR